MISRMLSVVSSFSLIVLVSGCGSNSAIVDTGQLAKESGRKSLPADKEDKLGLVSSSTAYGETEPWFISDSLGNPLSYKPVNFDLAASSFRFVWFDTVEQGCSGALAYELNSITKLYDVYLVTAHHCLYRADPLGRLAIGPLKGPVNFKTMRFAAVLNDPAVVRVDSVSGKSGRLRTYNEVWDIPTGSGVTAFTPYTRTPERLGSYDVVRFKMEQNLSLQQAQRKALPFCPTTVVTPDKDSPSKNVRMVFGYSANYASLQTQRFSIPLTTSTTNTLGRYGLPTQVLSYLSGATSTATNQVFAYTNLEPLTYANEYTGSSLSYAQDSGAPIFYASHSYASNDRNFGSYWKTVGMQATNKYRVDKIECLSGTITREYASNQRIYKFQNQYLYTSYGDVLKSDNSIVFVESRANSVWTPIQ